MLTGIHPVPGDDVKPSQSKADTEYVSICAMLSLWTHWLEVNGSSTAAIRMLLWFVQEVARVRELVWLKTTGTGVFNTNSLVWLKTAGTGVFNINSLVWGYWDRVFNAKCMFDGIPNATSSKITGTEYPAAKNSQLFSYLLHGKAGSIE